VSPVGLDDGTVDDLRGAIAEWGREPCDGASRLGLDLLCDSVHVFPGPVGLGILGDARTLEGRLVVVEADGIRAHRQAGHLFGIVERPVLSDELRQEVVDREVAELAFLDAGAEVEGDVVLREGVGEEVDVEEHIGQLAAESGGCELLCVLGGVVGGAAHLDLAVGELRRVGVGVLLKLGFEARDGREDDGAALDLSGGAGGIGAAARREQWEHRDGCGGNRQATDGCRT
jgi:hypothetical protein